MSHKMPGMSFKGDQEPQFNMKSPLDKKEEKQFSTKKDDPNRINVSDKYNVGDNISEEDLEGSVSQTGGATKNYPQLSVQDYSTVKGDDEGNYVTKL